MAPTNEVLSGLLIVFATDHLPRATGISTTARVDNSIFPQRLDATICQPMFLTTTGGPDERLRRVIGAARAIAHGRPRP